MNHFSKSMIFFLVMLIFQLSFAQEEHDYSREMLEKFGGQKIPSNLLNKISLDIDNEPLEAALDSITTQTQLAFNYPSNGIPLQKRITIKMDKVYALEALLSILKNTGTTLQITNGGMLALLPQNERPSSYFGRIKGTVVDKDTGEPLPGANVVVKGTAIGSASNIEGEFSIPRIQPGSYTLDVTFIGYKQEFVDVTVQTNKTTQITVNMDYDVLEGTEVIVSAQREGQIAAINQQLTANSIMNVVSADRIQELPDANAAEAIGRLPGIAVQRSAGEASKVMIRGLQPKLSTITVNGVKMPATDGQDRSVDLSMISPDLLAGIEVFKSPTPDMDAEALGGTVNLVLQKAPDARTIRVRGYGGYNHQNDDWGDYKSSAMMSNRFFNRSLGVIAGVNLERFNRGSQSLSASYTSLGVRDASGKYLQQTNTVSLSNGAQIRKRWGANLNLDYEFLNGSIVLTNFYSETSREIFNQSLNYSAENATSGYSATSQETELKAFSNAISINQNVAGMDITMGVSRYEINSDYPYYSSLTFTQTSSFNTNPDNMPDGGILYNPNLTPDQIPLATHVDLENTKLRNASVVMDSTNQVDYTYQFDLQKPVVIGSKIAGFIKMGGKYFSTKRDHGAGTRGDFFYYLGGNQTQTAINNHPTSLILTSNGDYISLLNFVDPNTSVDNFLDGDYDYHTILDEDKVKDWNTYHNSEYRTDRSGIVNNYNLEESISAGYIMAKLNFGQKLTLIPGVRYEHSDNEYSAKWSTISGDYGALGYAQDTTTTQNYGHWLPHLHVKYQPLSWFDLRLSTTRTLARPDFSALSPRTQLNIDTQRIVRGNPDLKAAKSWNYDITASIYSNSFGLFTFSGFYKDIEDIFYSKTTYIVKDDDVIKYQIPGQTKGWRMTYTENSTAQVWGFETDVQTQLRFLPGLLKGIVFNANYSVFKSEALFPETDLDVEIDYSTYPFTSIYTVTDSYRKGKMPGQADQIANLALGYDIGSFSVRVSANYQGKFISSVGTIEEIDRYTDEFWRWDASAKYHLNDHMSLHLNLINFTNQYDHHYLGYVTYPTSMQYYGRAGNAGIEYVF